MASTVTAFTFYEQALRPNRAERIPSGILSGQRERRGAWRGWVEARDVDRRNHWHAQVDRKARSGRCRWHRNARRWTLRDQVGPRGDRQRRLVDGRRDEEFCHQWC